jgi:peptidoglycan/xylan/chitin deacetylase (PgdA/CDA1 family)
MHDGGGDRSQTADALPAVIEGLLTRGFRFARVDDVGFAGA